ncbi:hypothetical protein GYMLUDRAFT_253012 [Collybiopsis luxurians FD-317 M1]|uniref:Uncharacterized protein n=1 Tax=Collybiopsis luxurians FD-317 M1 TaxID=944289 RepID=A0A0D0BLZ6_9AGAR|nr:hypothetical protein GYMLUDRAFT_253012 [Collybiopsis luxurians FD-317 M1]
MATKNEELVVENNRLKATIETLTGAIYELLLQRFEALALQNEQLKDKVIDQQTLIRTLLRSQVNQCLGQHYNGQGVGGTNSSQSTHHFSGQFVPAQ